ncbi:hypothetical protein PHLCEN_2v4686 [Hermanssonia centrifuga]|uniref:F-box domain-containing protein n=1 Tax=Hermanssonia centrifuga TaxID=98765 RepID=A0A2R6PN07_9APHY|nr:hypothetical protein PHLCEN_2v4686 [Hermanssonia centrifuga]
MSCPLVDLLDDCILLVVQCLPLLDIVALRKTCTRLAYISRLRTVWHTVYRRFSALIPMPLLPNTALPVSLDAESTTAAVLEQLCVYAHRLHHRWTETLPVPTSIRKIRHVGPSVDDVHLLPGGRWLVQVYRTTNVTLWDLAKASLSHSTTSHNEVAASSSTALIRHEALHVLVQAHETRSLLTCSTQIYIHTLALNRPAAHSRTLPPLALKSSQSSALDANGHLLSFHVYEEDDVSEIYVLDWTCPALKGVILCSSALDDLPPQTRTYTRALALPTNSYVLLATSSGQIFLFLVPPLSASSALARLQVAPIAHTTLPIPFRPIDTIEYVGQWSTSASRINNQTAYTLSLTTHTQLYSLTFCPFSLSSSQWSYDEHYDSSPSTLSVRSVVLSFISSALPARGVQRHPALLASFGGSALRGMYIENSNLIPEYRSALGIRLVLFAGPFPSSPTPSSDHLPQVREPAASSLRPPTEKELQEWAAGRNRDEELRNPRVMRRVVLEGVMSPKDVDRVWVDEGSGRVCLRHRAAGEGRFDYTVMDFGPSPGLAMGI